MAEESAFHRGGGEIVMAEIRGQCNGNATKRPCTERFARPRPRDSALAGVNFSRLPAPAKHCALGLHAGRSMEHGQIEQLSGELARLAQAAARGSRCPRNAGLLERREH